MNILSLRTVSKLTSIAVAVLALTPASAKVIYHTIPDITSVNPITKNGTASAMVTWKEYNQDWVNLNKTGIKFTQSTHVNLGTIKFRGYSAEIYTGIQGKIYNNGKPSNLQFNLAPFTGNQSDKTSHNTIDSFFSTSGRANNIGREVQYGITNQFIVSTSEVKPGTVFTFYKSLNSYSTPESRITNTFSQDNWLFLGNKSLGFNVTDTNVVISNNATVVVESNATGLAQLGERSSLTIQGDVAIKGVNNAIILGSADNSISIASSANKRLLDGAEKDEYLGSLMVEDATAAKTVIQAKEDNQSLTSTGTISVGALNTLIATTKDKGLFTLNLAAGSDTFINAPKTAPTGSNKAYHSRLVDHKNQTFNFTLGGNFTANGHSYVITSAKDTSLNLEFLAGSNFTAGSKDPSNEVDNSQLRVIDADSTINANFAGKMHIGDSGRFFVTKGNATSNLNLTASGTLEVADSNTKFVDNAGTLNLNIAGKVEVSSGAKLVTGKAGTAQINVSQGGYLNVTGQNSVALSRDGDVEESIHNSGHIKVSGTGAKLIYNNGGNSKNLNFQTTASSQTRIENGAMLVQQTATAGNDRRVNLDLAGDLAVDGNGSYLAVSSGVANAEKGAGKATFTLTTQEGSNFNLTDTAQGLKNLGSVVSLNFKGNVKQTAGTKLLDSYNPVQVSFEQGSGSTYLVSGENAVGLLARSTQLSHNASGKTEVSGGAKFAQLLTNGVANFNFSASSSLNLSDKGSFGLVLENEQSELNLSGKVNATKEARFVNQKNQSVNLTANAGSELEASAKSYFYNIDAGNLSANISGSFNISEGARGFVLAKDGANANLSFLDGSNLNVSGTNSIGFYVNSTPAASAPATLDDADNTKTATPDQQLKIQGDLALSDGGRLVHVTDHGSVNLQITKPTSITTGGNLVFSNGKVELVASGKLTANNTNGASLLVFSQGANASLKADFTGGVALDNITLVNSNNQLELNLAGESSFSNKAKVLQLDSLVQNQGSAPAVKVNFGKDAQVVFNGTDGVISKVNAGNFTNQGTVKVTNNGKLFNLGTAAEAEASGATSFSNTGKVALEASVLAYQAGASQLNLSNHGEIDLAGAFGLVAVNANATGGLVVDNNGTIKVSSKRVGASTHILDTSKAAGFTTSLVNREHGTIAEVEATETKYPLFNLGAKSRFINQGTMIGNITTAGSYVVLGNKSYLQGTLKLLDNASLLIRDFNGTAPQVEFAGQNHELGLNNVTLNGVNYAGLTSLTLLGEATVTNSVLSFNPNQGSVNKHLFAEQDPSAEYLAASATNEADPASANNDIEKADLNTNAVSLASQNLPDSAATNSKVLTLNNATILLNNTAKVLNADKVVLAGNNNFLVNGAALKSGVKLSEVLGVSAVEGDADSISKNLFNRWLAVAGANDFTLLRRTPYEVIDAPLLPLYQLTTSEANLENWGAVDQLLQTNETKAGLRRDLLRLSGYEFGYLVDGFAQRLNSFNPTRNNYNARRLTNGDAALELSINHSEQNLGVRSGRNSFDPYYAGAEVVSFAKGQSQALTLNYRQDLATIEPGYPEFSTSLVASYGKSKYQFETDSKATSKDLILGGNGQVYFENGLTVNGGLYFAYSKVGLNRDALGTYVNGKEATVAFRNYRTDYAIAGARAFIETDYRFYQTRNLALNALAGYSHSYLLQEELFEQEEIRGETNKNKASYQPALVNRVRQQEYQSRLAHLGLTLNYYGYLASLPVTLKLGFKQYLEFGDLSQAKLTKLKDFGEYRYYTNRNKYSSELYAHLGVTLSRYSSLYLNAQAKFGRGVSEHNLGLTYVVRTNAIPDFFTYFNQSSANINRYMHSLSFALSNEIPKRELFWDNGRLYYNNSLATPVINPIFEYVIKDRRNSDFKFTLNSEFETNRTKDYTVEKERRGNNFLVRLENTYYDLSFTQSSKTLPNAVFYRNKVAVNYRDEKRVVKAWLKSKPGFWFGVKESYTTRSELNNFVRNDAGDLNLDLNTPELYANAGRVLSENTKRRFDWLFRYYKKIELPYGNIWTTNTLSIDKNANPVDRVIFNANLKAELVQPTAWGKFTEKPEVAYYYNYTGGKRKLTLKNELNFTVNRQLFGVLRPAFRHNYFYERDLYTKSRLTNQSIQFELAYATNNGTQIKGVLSRHINSLKFLTDPTTGVRTKYYSFAGYSFTMVLSKLIFNNLSLYSSVAYIVQDDRKGRHYTIIKPYLKLTYNF